MTTRDVETAHGRARVHVAPVEGARPVMVLGHGARGRDRAPDLTAAAAAARSAGVAVVLVEQPYRVAGRRSPAPAAHLDAAWTSVVEHLRTADFDGVPLLVGGRSSGARVACRTSAATAARGVLCLAFPLAPPARRSATTPPVSRQEELDRVAVPTLVVQGVRDRFGMPPATATRTVVAVAGDHSLRTDPAAVATAVREWLTDVLHAIDAAPR